MRLTISEANLNGLMSCVLDSMLTEARGIKSKKLYDLVQQHGGFHRDDYQHKIADIHNMADDDILGVMTPDQLRRVQYEHTVDHWRWSENYGLDIWAKEQGIPLGRTDSVEAMHMHDGNYIVFILRNGRFDTRANTPEDGFKALYKKRNERRRNNSWWGDGAKSYQWNNKEAHDIRTNPWFKEWPKEHQDAKMDRARQEHAANQERYRQNQK